MMMSMSAEVYFSVLMLVTRPGTWEDALAIFKELRRYACLSCVFHVPCGKISRKLLESASFCFTG